VHYCQAIRGVSGTVAQVGENRFGSRWLFGNGGSGVVCDRSFVGMNRLRWRYKRLKVAIKTIWRISILR
jgi:hypothetical protein